MSLRKLGNCLSLKDLASRGNGAERQSRRVDHHRFHVHLFHPTASHTSHYSKKQNFSELIEALSHSAKQVY
jgi:hypothetical protein